MCTVVRRITIIELEVNNGGDSWCCFGIKIREDAVKFTKMLIEMD